MKRRLENPKRSHNALLESTDSTSKVCKLDSRETDALQKSEDRFRFGFHRIALSESMKKRYFDINANRELVSDTSETSSVSKRAQTLTASNKSIKSVAQPTPIIKYTKAANIRNDYTRYNREDNAMGKLKASNGNEEVVKAEGTKGRKCVTMQIRDILDETLGSEWTEKMTMLLKTRLKTSRYSRQPRAEEQIKLIGELKTALKTYCHVFENVNRLLNSKLMKEQASSTHRLVEMEKEVIDANERTVTLTKNLQEYEKRQKLSLIRVAEYEAKLEKYDSCIKKSEQEKKELEISNQLLQTKMQTCDHECEKLRLHLRSLEITLSDRDFLREEKNKEMQQFYEKFDQAEEKK